MLESEALYIRKAGEEIRDQVCDWLFCYVLLSSSMLKYLDALDCELNYD